MGNPAFEALIFFNIRDFYLLGDKTLIKFHANFFIPDSTANRLKPNMTKHKIHTDKLASQTCLF